MKDYAGQAMTCLRRSPGRRDEEESGPGGGIYQQDAIFMDPANPSAAPILWNGADGKGGLAKSLPVPWIFSPTWSNYPHVWNLTAPGTNGNFKIFQIAAVEHLVLCHCHDDRRPGLLHPGGLWFLALPLPGTGFLVRHPDLDHLPAGRGDHHPDISHSSPRSAGWAPGCR